MGYHALVRHNGLSGKIFSFVSHAAVEGYPRGLEAFKVIPALCLSACIGLGEAVDLAGMAHRLQGVCPGGAESVKRPLVGLRGLAAMWSALAGSYTPHTGLSADDGADAASGFVGIAAVLARISGSGLGPTAQRRQTALDCDIVTLVSAAILLHCLAYA